ncbi:unnamed protein product [Meganyctiphanes norvegica]|uniref:Uncharacterized protein n=1 Tax=Meganyctiphanes norvegica TaxID=48144 RepID=A0AAV2QV17_MEGNR
MENNIRDLEQHITKVTVEIECLKKKPLVIQLDPHIVTATIAEDRKKKNECLQVMSKAFFEEGRVVSLGFALLENKIQDKENQIRLIKQSMAIMISKTQRYISHIIRKNNEIVGNMESDIHYMEYEYDRLERHFLQLQHTFSENKYFLNNELYNSNMQCQMLSDKLVNEIYTSAHKDKVLKKLKQKWVTANLQT